MSNYARKYAVTWKRFTRLSETHNLVTGKAHVWQRWVSLPYIGFIVPIDDPAAQAQLAAWQQDMAPWLRHATPPERLHITLHHAGGLRQHRWSLLPHTWQRSELPQLAQRVRDAFTSFPAFEIAIGPLNAFAAVLFAEVQDPDRCLQLLRARIRRTLPLRARPVMTWAFLPHITLGFWGQQPAGPVADALRPHRDIEPFRMRVNRVKFTIYVRDTVPDDHIVFGQDREDVIEEFKLKEE